MNSNTITKFLISRTLLGFSQDLKEIDGTISDLLLLASTNLQKQVQFDVSDNEKQAKPAEVEETSIDVKKEYVKLESTSIDSSKKVEDPDGVTVDTCLAYCDCHTQMGSPDTPNLPEEISPDDVEDKIQSIISDIKKELEM